MKKSIGRRFFYLIYILIPILLLNCTPLWAGIPGDMDLDNDVDGQDIAAYGALLAEGVAELPVEEFVGQFAAMISDVDQMALTSGLTPPSGSTIKPPNLSFSWTTGPTGTSWYLFRIGTSAFDPHSYLWHGAYWLGHTYTTDSIDIDDSSVTSDVVRLAVHYVDWAGNETGYAYRYFYRPRITSPTTPTLTSSSITVEWEPGNDYGYASVGVGTEDDPMRYGYSNPVFERQVTCDPIPVNGSEIRVQVRMFDTEGNLFRDTVKHYTAYDWTKDDFQMLPEEDTILPGSEITFDWEDLPLVEHYGIRIGTGAPGHSDIQANKNLGTTSQFTSSLIPEDGRTIYVRLFYEYDGDDNECSLFSDCPYVDFIYHANDHTDLIPVRCAFQGEPDYVADPTDPEIYQPGHFSVTCWISLLHLWTYAQESSISICDVKASLLMELLEENKPNDPDTTGLLKFNRDYTESEDMDGSCPLDDPLIAVRISLPPDDRATNLLPFDLFPDNGIEDFVTGNIKDPYVRVLGKDPMDEIKGESVDIWNSMLGTQIPVLHEFDRAVNYGHDAVDYTVQLISDLPMYDMFDYIVYKFPVNSAVLKAGGWRYTLTVDPDFEVDEHNETNNELQGEFEVHHFPTPPPDSTDELPSAQEPVCTTNGSTEEVVGYKVDAYNGAFWDGGSLKISSGWDHWVDKTWINYDGTTWDSTINKSEMAMMVMAEFWGPKGSGVIRRATDGDEPFYDGDAGCSGCTNPRPRPEQIHNIIWFSAGQASCGDYARITGQPEDCEPSSGDEKMQVSLVGGIKNVPAQIVLKEDMYPEYERSNTLMAMAFDNEYDKVAETREDNRSIEEGWLRYFKERTNDYQNVTHIWLGGMSRGAVLSIQLAKRLQEMKRYRPDMRDITIVVTGNDPVTDSIEWRYDSECTDGCSHSAGDRFDVWSKWYREHRTGRYDSLFQTSGSDNPNSWSGMQDNFWLRILAGDGAQADGARTGACAQVFVGQIELVDGEGTFIWNWDDERWDSYGGFYGGVPFLTQRWTPKSHKAIRHHFGSGTQGLMRYAYYKLWGYGTYGTEEFRIVNPAEGDALVSDECNYELITSQNLTTGTIRLKERSASTYHAQLIRPNKALVPKVVYIPLSYDPSDSIYVSIKTVDRLDLDNPLAGDTIFYADNKTYSDDYGWYRFADKTVDERLSTDKRYWLIVHPMGTPQNDKLGVIGVADMIIPATDVYLGGHRSRLVGSWTHYPDQNDLLFRIYGEDVRP